MMRRALAIDEAAREADHPTVAVRLNNLAHLLKVTNRRAEAEPMIKRAVEIYLRSQRDNGHPHHRQETVLRNYRFLLGEMGMSEPDAEAKLAALAAKYGVSLVS